MKAENIHYDKVHKKKQHFASKCNKAKCTICHSSKVLNIPNRQLLRENSKKAE